MDLRERKQKEVLLDESFTVDLLHTDDGGPDERCYRIGLSALGSIREYPPMRTGFSDSMITCVTATYPEQWDNGYSIQPETIEHPAGMTRRDAISVLKAIFEESGRGAAVDDDWVWKPIVLETYLSPIFPSPRHLEIAALLRNEVHFRNAQVVNPEKIKDSNATC